MDCQPGEYFHAVSVPCLEAIFYPCTQPGTDRAPGRSNGDAMLEILGINISNVLRYGE
jgi:hypothetical protein